MGDDDNVQKIQEAKNFENSTDSLNSPFFFYCKSYVEKHEKWLDVTVPLWWESVPDKLEKKLLKRWEGMSKDGKKPYVILSNQIADEAATLAPLIHRNKYLGVYKNTHPNDESVSNLVLEPNGYWSSCPDKVKELAYTRWNTMTDKEKVRYYVEATALLEERMKK